MNEHLRLPREITVYVYNLALAVIRASIKGHRRAKVGGYFGTRVEVLLLASRGVCILIQVYRIAKPA